MKGSFFDASVFSAGNRPFFVIGEALPLTEDGRDLTEMPFPLTLDPSPLGRGKQRWRRALGMRRSVSSLTGEGSSLSLRERARVRGKGVVENTIGHFLNTDDRPANSLKMPKTSFLIPLQGGEGGQAARRNCFTNANPGQRIFPMRISWILLLLVWLAISGVSGFGVERFPPPDFESGYKFPPTTAIEPRAQWLQYLSLIHI